MDGGNVAARQACFHLPSSSAELTEMISGIVCAEGPLPLDALKHRVATAHDWGRAGRQISARIMACSSEIELHDEAGVIFAWQKDGHFPRAVYRHVPGRVVREISRHELADLLDRNAAAVNAAADPVRDRGRGPPYAICHGIPRGMSCMVACQPALPGDMTAAIEGEMVVSSSGSMLTFHHTSGSMLRFAAGRTVTRLIGQTIRDRLSGQLEGQGTVIYIKKRRYPDRRWCHAGLEMGKLARGEAACRTGAGLGIEGG
nr:DUF3320 domain-containing protein [Paracoccus sp. S-4012]